MNAQDIEFLKENVTKHGIIDGNRHTGRTLLMLKNAIAAAEAGIPVCVIAGDHRSAMNLEFMAIRDLGAKRGLIRFSSFDCAHKELPGFRGAIFRDHFAVECEALDLAVRLNKAERRLEDLKRSADPRAAR